MIPVVLLVTVIASSPEFCPDDKPFDDPLMAKLEDGVRKSLKQSQDAVAEQLKIRANLLASWANRPLTPLQLSRLDICDQIIRDQGNFAAKDQQRLDALIRLKRGVPWDEAGCPLPKGVPPATGK